MRWLLVVALCSFSLLAAPANVHAQDDAARSASARSFFEEGVKFADAGQWTDAADRFRRALSMRDSQVIRFNLASALVELGQLVEASELLRQVERDGATEAGLREQATTQLASVGPRIAKLTVQVDGDLNGANISLDDRPLVAAQLGVGIPTDPGVHQVRAERDGTQVDEQTVTLAEGAAETLTIHPTAVATPAEAAALVPVTAPTSGERRDAGPSDGRRSKLLWWGIGGGVVAVVAIAVIGVLAAGGSGSSGAKTYKGDFEPGSIPVTVAP